MIGHQRDILATLGIDIWIAKDSVCQNMPSSSSIWRDQAAAEYVSEIIVAKTQPILSEPQLEPPKVVAQIAQRLQTISEVTEIPLVAPVIAVKDQVAQYVAPFQLQAFALPHCIVVVDTTEITAAQQPLWRNIQQALSAEHYVLHWPFALMDFQDGRGAGSYVQGFLDAASVDKNIIFLGQFPYFQHANSMQLAGLQEMLDQPLLKKRLWQFMQKTN